MNKLYTVLFLLILSLSCAAQQESSKINGVSFVSNRHSVDSSHVNPVRNVKANYAAVMPFAFIRSEEKSKVVYNSQGQWYGERIEGGRNYITQLQKGNIKVMLKPQVWIRHGEYTGYLKMETEEKWVELEESYRNFILVYAKLAQEEKTKIFCIGTELEQFVVNRPEYWKQLIKDIKKIYKGKLTYAANWDEYKRVTFWDQLDYVGIDGYFPVSDSETPSVAEAMEGWRSWKEEMSAFAKAQNKKILFTEWGYRSMDFTGKEPWVSDRGIDNVNLEAQANATQAVFETLWTEDWFAGGFVWKWFIFHDRSGGPENNRFTPQNKPAEDVIRNYYEKY